LLQLARWGKHVIGISFAISVLYNLVGLSISFQGLMSPMIAAILMPVSTISIVLITTGLSSLAAKYFRLSVGK
jgi:Cu+-exporting ATPase